MCCGRRQQRSAKDRDDGRARARAVCLFGRAATHVNAFGATPRASISALSSSPARHSPAWPAAVMAAEYVTTLGATPRASISRSSASADVKSRARPHAEIVVLYTILREWRARARA